MGKFLYTYAKEIIPLHDELLDRLRDINDIKALHGDKNSRHRSEITTPLTAITREGDLSVQEQFSRRWEGKEYAKLDDIKPGMSPASEQIKDLYSSLVLVTHPMLGHDKDIQRLQRAFHDATMAYIRRDVVTLEALLDTYPKTSLPALINTAQIRDIEEKAVAVETLAKHLESQLFEVKYGDAAKLYVQTEFMKKRNVDLLSELKKQLKQEIRLAQESIKLLTQTN